MSIDELTRAEPSLKHRSRPGSRRPWMALLGAVAVVFVVYALPPYLTLDPDRARLQPFPPFPAYYPLLVIHIVHGPAGRLAPGVALAAAKPSAGASNVRPDLRVGGVAGLDLRAGHRSDGLARGKPAGGQHDAGRAVVHDHAGWAGWST
jgi:hypothetical protein